MLYRPYRPEDFAQLYAVEEVCFEPPFRFSRSLMRRLVQSADAATWIAEEKEQVAGFAIVEWTRNADAVIAYILTIEVASEHRRRGVARELLSLIERSAHDAGAATIWLHVDAENDAAIRLYETHSYRHQGREANYYPRGRTALIYIKTL